MSLARVLVVEDDALERQLFRRQVTDPRLTLTWATTLRDALEHLAARSYDVVVLDRGLPDALSGRSVVEAITASAGHAWVLVLSVEMSREAIIGSFQAGAHGYLIKHQHRETPGFPGLETLLLAAAAASERQRQREAQTAAEYQRLTAQVEVATRGSLSALLARQLLELPPVQRAAVAGSIVTLIGTLGVPLIAGAVELARLLVASGP